MVTWIALLRGVNVGGKNRLPMKDLVSSLEALGFSDVRTYLQSGNVVFLGPDDAPALLSSKIGAAVDARFGFLPQVVVIRADVFTSFASANPFPEATNERDGKTLHLFFLSEPPHTIDGERLDAVKRPTERWRVIGPVFYLHTPDGFGNSRLATQAERILGVAATARNWRTVGALVGMAGGSA